MRPPDPTVHSLLPPVFLLVTELLAWFWATQLVMAAVSLGLALGWGDEGGMSGLILLLQCCYFRSDKSPLHGCLKCTASCLLVLVVGRWELDQPLYCAHWPDLHQISIWEFYCDSNHHGRMWGHACIFESPLKLSSHSLSPAVQVLSYRHVIQTLRNPTCPHRTTHSSPRGS